jgi:2-methylcitrate dehydratase PrpD
MSSHLESSAPPVTRELAAFTVKAVHEGIAERTRREAVRTFVNWLGCAIGGARHPAVDIALDALAPYSGPAEFTVPGREPKADLFGATLAMGIASHVFDFDDTHLKTIIHPAGPVASALLPLSERDRLSGSAFLVALIVGVEVECRLGNAVYPAHYDIGWHITGTTGVFGAAAAASRVLGLDGDQATYALGIAGTQSSGFREMFGSMCKSFHVGAAAKNGLLAALLAQRGFTSSTRGIEAPRGFANVMSTTRDYDEISQDLGVRWESELNTYKPFACGIVIHPSIDGAVQVARDSGVAAEDVASIELTVHPLVLELTGNKAPKTGLQSKFSVFHAAAAGYIYGRAGEHEFSDEVVTDSCVIALRDKITASVGPGIREDEVRIVLTTRDGRRIEKHVEHSIGSLDRPLTDDGISAKFLDLAEAVIGRDAARRALESAWAVEGSEDLTQLLAIARSKPLRSAAE